ncbi:sugar phosphate isomerase/epimerase family protein [Singulisphaera acidiphila]|uniref:Sugar phosphate isomerase/epimerase n=1 Tax=Singulisphaera acidiphila (strain ATCC BAA-1392 / DSM 18658 / VKM B-2454 / MOB10) TaxID=886293 RepID=L0DEN7_SINAD|nr:sugar phosphate isomerase/epimerase family protein [Singulisphaera acidiphila]AGA27131.1 sugar phosphate isomerase/epimerase [Singulisphaera acidiphila DSM 18658]
MTEFSRRGWLATVPAALGAGLTLGAQGSSKARAADDPSASPFGFCFNTSTIQGQKLPISEVVDIVGKAGYQGIEPWIRELDQYVKEGGSLKDLGKRIADHGLSVEDAIGFFAWSVDDEAERRKGLEEAKRNMEMVLSIGGHRIAAPPAGATDRSDLDLKRIAERYRTLLELGDSIGVVPQVEIWGFSKTLGRLSEAAMVAIDSGHPKACILPDVYHLHKGGSSFEGLKLLSGQAFHLFHLNDYPDAPSRENITDAHRVYPGDGVAPLRAVFQTLKAVGYRGMLSLELFNREYWKQDPLLVARTGLEKMREAVRQGLA